MAITVVAVAPQPRVSGPYGSGSYSGTGEGSQVAGWLHRYGDVYKYIVTVGSADSRSP